MSNVIINQEKSPISKSDLEKVEKHLGFYLPTQYGNFLLIHNGGQPEPSVFNIQSGKLGDDSQVDWFLCIKDGEDDDLLNYYSDYQNRIPKELLPIAFDPGGNLICIGVEGEFVGKIYFWDHEKEGEQVLSYDNVYFIAPDFDTFLNSLYELIF